MKSLSRVLAAALILIATGSAMADEERIDQSNPTKIYTFAGGGLKYTSYTNGESMWEMRTVANIGLSDNDMVLAELGYGFHSGDKVEGSNERLTNARARWFHLFDMNDDLAWGYRGWGTQVDLQLAGKLKGTDGQNVLSVGVLPAFGLGEKWSLYLPVNLVNSWDKGFEKYNGMGIGVSPLLIYLAGDDWWRGAYVSFWPNYIRFFSGELKGDGSGNFDLNFGGEITPTVFWMSTLQKNFDKNLRSFRPGEDTGLTNDWNVFFQVTTYF